MVQVKRHVGLLLLMTVTELTVTMIWTRSHPLLCTQIDKCFGFDTAVEQAQEALLAAKVEASSAYRGVGVVKLMGRSSGFIAMQASLASGVDPFSLMGCDKPEACRHLSSASAAHGNSTPLYFKRSSYCACKSSAPPTVPAGSTLHTRFVPHDCCMMSAKFFCSN